MRGIRAGQITFLCDRQRDDPRFRRGQRVDQRLRLLRPDDHVADRADHAHRLTGTVADDEAVEAILGGQRIAYRRRTQRRGGDAEAEIVEYHRLMGAMEGADAEMDDTWRRPCLGPHDPVRQPIERRLAEARGHSL
jgi:hypothetical protein